MKPVFQEIDNWAGVSTSAPPDALPPGFSPRMHNTTLVNIGQGQAQVGARKGPLTCNVTPLTGSPIILGIYQLKQTNGTKTTLLVSDGGRLDKLNTDFTTTPINATAFTPGENFPSFATVNNCAIIANGTDLKKTDGTTVWAVGMVPPAVGPTATPAAGGAMLANAWDVAITYYNSNTGEESSLSPFTTATLSGGSLQINASWSAPTDPQVTHVRVYLRDQTLGPNAYLVVNGAGMTPDCNATFNAFPVATLSTTINVGSTAFGALKIVSPTTTSNNPPATTLKYPVWHNGRLFLFDTGNAYFSNITNLTSHAESFDPNNVEPINPNDGDFITGAISAYQRLFIFKRYSMWVLEGYDPASWTVTLISDKYGCGSHRSIKMAGGAIHWWSNTALGPLMMANPLAQPEEIGKEMLFPTVSDSSLNTLLLNYVVAEVDEPNDLILWSVPASGSATRNNVIIPWNYRLKRFVADLWNPMDISCFGIVEDVASLRSVYAGGYAGQVFKWWQATNDGVPNGTTDSGMVTAATTTTLTDSHAAFSTTGGALIERYVYHIPAVGSVQRARITSNTATQLTFTPAFNQMPVVGDTYVVGGIDWQVDIPWQKFGAPFLKKRFDFFFLEGTAVQSGAIINVDVFTKDDLTAPKKTISVPVGAAGAIYDQSLYDSGATYSASPFLSKRKHIGLVGKSILLRLRQLQADIQVGLNKVAIEANLLGSKT